MSVELISTAYAAGTAAGHPQGGYGQMAIMIALFVAVFYFLLLRPQNKRAKEHRALLSGLQKGDEVSTTAGMIGSVTKVDDNYVTIEIAENVVIKLQKSAIASVLPKGTLKTI